MSDLGLSITDGLQLLEYNDLQYFVDRYSRRKQREKIIEAINRVDELIMVQGLFQSKKGQASYSRWKRDQTEKLEELDILENGTVFDKMKLEAKKSRKNLTVFDRLKRRLKN